MTAVSQDAKPAARREASRPAFPPVVRIGIALGVFLAVEALIHGVILPLALGVIADATLTVLLAIALGVILAELTRRHHKTAARHGWEYGKRGAHAAARGTGRGAAFVARGAAARSRPWRTRIIAAVRARWAALRGTAPAASEPAEAATGSTGCPACGRPLPGDGTCPACAASASNDPVPSQPKGNTMSPSNIAPERRARRNAAKAGSGTVPAEWGPSSRRPPTSNPRTTASSWSG